MVAVQRLDKSGVDELFLRGVPISDGERALPGRGTAFLEKPWEKHQGCWFNVVSLWIESKCPPDTSTLDPECQP